MSLLTPEEFAECRKCIGLEMTDEEKDELIRIVDGIVTAFVDQAFGFHPVQLSLAAQANRHFQAEPDHDSLGLFPDDEQVDLDTEGASNTPNSPAGQVSP